MLSLHQKKLDGELSTLMEHITFVHPRLNLSQMDLFKVVYDRKITYNEKVPPSREVGVFSGEVSWVEHEGNKAIEDFP